MKSVFFFVLLQTIKSKLGCNVSHPERKIWFDPIVDASLEYRNDTHKIVPSSPDKWVVAFYSYVSQLYAFPLRFIQFCFPFQFTRKQLICETRYAALHFHKCPFDTCLRLTVALNSSPLASYNIYNRTEPRFHEAMCPYPHSTPHTIFERYLGFLHWNSITLAPILLPSHIALVQSQNVSPSKKQPAATQLTTTPFQTFRHILWFIWSTILGAQRTPRFHEGESKQMGLTCTNDKKDLLNL